MPSYIPIGLGAGLCAAVLFASAVLGQSALGVILLFIVPLPKFLAGLGWGWPAALTAVITATALVGGVASPRAGLAYGISQGLPAVWLCYLVYLNRVVGSTDDSNTPRIQWYPIGRILAWTAGIAGSLTAVTLLTMGTTAEELRQQTGQIVEMIMKSVGQVDPTAGSTMNVQALTELMLYLMPAAFAVSWVTGLLFNLWLAGRITLASGRLLRPWPDLAATTLPRGAALGLALTTAAALPVDWTGVPELLRMMASGFSSALFFAYMLIGIAIAHYVTRGRPWRLAALVGMYAGLLLLNTWAALVLALVGLAEPLAPWRRQFGPPQAPPGAPPPPGGISS